MGAGRAHLGGHGWMAMQGITGDNAAFQNQAFERRKRACDLVASRRVPGRQRQPRLGIPYADHQRRHAGAAAFIGVAQALAVDRDHPLGRIKSEPFAQFRDKTSENLRHLVGIQQPKHSAEAVVARCAVTKLDNFGKLLLVSGSKICDIDARLRPTQSRGQRSEQHCRKIVPSIEVTRVANFSENRNKCFHAGSPESGKPPSKSTSSSNAIEFYSDAIPLPCRGRGPSCRSRGKPEIGAPGGGLPQMRNFQISMPGTGRALTMHQQTRSIGPPTAR